MLHPWDWAEHLRAKKSLEEETSKKLFWWRVKTFIYYIMYICIYVKHIYVFFCVYVCGFCTSPGLMVVNSVCPAAASHMQAWHEHWGWKKSCTMLVSTSVMGL